MIDINFKKLSPSATIPTKAHPTDACFDLYLDEPNSFYYNYSTNTYYQGVKIEPHTYIPLHTGLAAEIPDGYYAAIYARSGLSVKKGLRPTNCTGIIDNQYRGEWIVALYNDSNFAQVLDHKDRIAQFAILPVLDVNLNEVEELSETERGTGSFGSSGK